MGSSVPVGSAPGLGPPGPPLDGVDPGSLAGFARPASRPRARLQGIGADFAGKAGGALAPPANDGGFTAALARAIEARRGAPERLAPGQTTGLRDAPRAASGRPAEVARQLKQLVSASREALDPQVSGALQRGRDDRQALEPGGRAEALRSLHRRLVDTEPTQRPGPDAGAGRTTLESQRDAAVDALLDTVAGVVAQSVNADGEIDEATLAARLATDPQALAAAEALVAAAQALVTLTPGSLSATGVATGVATVVEPGRTPGDAASGGAGGVAGATEAGLGIPADAPSPASPLAGTQAGAVATPGAAGSSTETGNAAGASAAPAATAAASAATGASPAAAAAPGALDTVANAAGQAPASAAAPAAPVEAAGDGARPGPVSPAQLPVSSPAAGDVDGAIGANSSAGSAAATTVQAASPPAAQAADTPVQAVLAAVAEVAVQSPPAGDGAGDGATPTLPGVPAAPEVQAVPDGQAAQEVPAAAAARDGAGGVPVGEPATGEPVAGVSSTQAGETLSAGKAAEATTAAPAGTVAAAPQARSEAVAGAEATVDLADSPEADLADQVAPAIVRQARLAGTGGNQELTLRLVPEHLGPLHVRISLAEGALRVGLTASSREAQQALETALPQLRTTLAEAGLRLDRLDVGVRDGRDGGSNGQRGFDPGNRGDDGNRGDANWTGRQFDGNGDTNGRTPFADLLIDQDGQPFGLGVRSARAAAAPSSPPSVPTSVPAAALRPAPGTLALSRVGYGAYGALRDLIARTFGNRS